MLLYVAGPLFSTAERSFNQQLTDKIEALRYRVFLPQRDGVESNEPPYDIMPPTTAAVLASLWIKITFSRAMSFYSSSMGAYRMKAHASN